MSRLLLLGSILATVGATFATAAPPEADYIGRLGFRDSKHTRSDGYQSSMVLGMTPTGYSFGESDRFFGVPDLEAGALPDLSAWIASPAAGTRSAGLYDSAHTSETGYHTSMIELFTQSGKVVGHSIRYEGQPIARGQSAWIADWNGGTRRIGLYYEGAAPLLDGTRHNEVLAVNEQGQTIGIALVEGGQSAWLAEPSGATRAIGFYDPAHTTPGGAPHNTPVAINPSGTAIGNTQLFNPPYERVAWLQPKNGGPPIQIGLYGEAHTVEGVSRNIAVAVNARGRVIGTAQRAPFAEFPINDGWLRNPDGSTVVFAGGSGQAAEVFDITDSDLVAGTYGNPGGSLGWVYDVAAGSTHPVGLSDPEVSTFNQWIALTENGVAIGSTTYYGHADRFLWLAPRNGPTYQIGLFTQLGSVPSINEVVDHNDSGYVVGSSYGVIGPRAWIASPLTGTTYPIGLFDAQHMGSEGAQGHVSFQVTNSRFVSGVSTRFTAGGASAGRTAWVYNSPAGAYARFDISVRASDGYSYSTIHHVTENGIALGTYRLFDADGTDLGDRAFVWITKRGVRDLGSALNVDLDAAGWERLAEAVIGNEAGFVAGQGTATSGGADGVFHLRVE